MSACALMLVRDEADIIGTTVRHLLSQVEEVLVLDNLSRDGTSDILHALAQETGRVQVIPDPEPAYWQSRKLTALAAEALARGHAWAVPCDADEVWYSAQGRVGDLLADLGPAVYVVTALVYDHVPTGADPAGELDPVRRIGWRRPEPCPLPKVACRLAPGLVIEQGNHGAHYPGPVTRAENVLAVRHFPNRSEDRFLAKARVGAEAYRLTDLPYEVGRHWRDYGQILELHGEEGLRQVWRQWFFAPDPHAAGLVYDPAPAQA